MKTSRNHRRLTLHLKYVLSVRCIILVPRGDKTKSFQDSLGTGIVYKLFSMSVYLGDFQSILNLGGLVIQNF